MRIVVALGGNAMLRRGQALSAENQRENIRSAAAGLAAVGREHELVIAHGNGPQVGLLALMDAHYRAVEPYPLDVLGAESVGMIGYVLEQELGNLMPVRGRVVTVLTQVVVDPADAAFAHPSKPVGPVYSRQESERMASEKGWAMAPDGEHFRRVVPSPLPREIVELEVIRLLVESGVVVICAGGGGIPVVSDERGRLRGVEAVIDKDLSSGLLSRELAADMLLMLTDVPNVYQNFGATGQRPIAAALPVNLEALTFAPGSMGPKVSAACQFVRATGKSAAIGRLTDLGAILRGEAGTRVSMDAAGIQYA